MGRCKTCHQEFLGNAKTFCLDCSYEREKERHRVAQLKSKRKQRDAKAINDSKH